MSSPKDTPSTSESAAAPYLRSLPAVRARTALLLQHPSHLKNFNLDLSNLPKVVDMVLSLISRDYPSPADIPPHSRWRHFEASVAPTHKKIKRLDPLIATWRKQDGVDDKEIVRRLLDLFVVSVLLDAGAGDAWTYCPANEQGAVYARSEGLALASLDWFLTGGLSSVPGKPHQVDAGSLESVTVEALKSAFQVDDTNPLVGVEGRCNLLRRLGGVCRQHTKFFGGAEIGNPPRPGNMLDFLLSHPTTQKSPNGTLTVEVTALWEVIMDGISGVWPPTRTKLAGMSLGDVWPSSAMQSISSVLPEPDRLVPQAQPLIAFHKLSQWLTYSLMEPLALLNIQFAGMENMTGLAEYRNGGLFVDLGVISLKEEVKSRFGEGQVPRFEVHDDAVVEWRALTVALLDKVGKEVREKLGMSEQELPLVKVLEAGTWKAGREIATKLRPKSKGPPIEIISDGTVF
ncbi:hypothetical protein HK104_011069 [Borealophlyctis nickersoniae]|nr:hypothetical protein HK104_011069 [Borealophlyctis nickersoniae]